jgi:hypothetical protein
LKTSNARAIGYLIGGIASPGFGLILLPFQRYIILRQIASTPCGLILLAGYFDSEKIDTPLAEAEGILNSATDLKMFCPYGNT